MRQRYSSALVTGASSGIGAEFAKVLAARGCDLVLVARRSERLDELRRELTGVEVEVLAADLTAEAGLASVEQRLRQSPVELLVNNAGVATSGAFAGSDLDEQDRLVRLNVLALTRLTRVALAPMVEARHGGIINVSSLASDQPLRGFASYAASKAFVTTFTESVAAEVRAAGVHVTVVKPGYVWTEMNPAGPSRRSFQGRFWLEAPVVARAAVDAVERGRLVSVAGLHWRAVSGLVNALPHQLVRSLTTRFDASG